MRRVLIAGLGNIFLGDDAFGVEAARAMAARTWPEGVAVRDFGVRCLDLAFCLTEGWGAAILVDAIARRTPPGTLHCLNLSHETARDLPAFDGHSVGAAQVLDLAARFSGGAALPHLFLVGCEPANLVEPGDALSPVVAAALPGAIAMVEALVAQLLASQPVEVQPA